MKAISHLLLIIIAFVLIMMILSSCTDKYQAFYQAENRKAPAAVKYKYVKPWSERKKLTVFLLIVVPLAVPFVIVSQTTPE